MRTVLFFSGSAPLVGLVTLVTFPLLISCSSASPSLANGDAGPDGMLVTVADASSDAAFSPLQQAIDWVMAAVNGAPVTDPAGAFAYIGYKGGSEPGVLNLTWLLRRKADDRWLFFTIAFNDDTQAIDEGTATYVAAAGRALLGKL